MPSTRPFRHSAALMPLFAAACATAERGDTAEFETAATLPSPVVAALAAGRAVDVLVRIDGAAGPADDGVAFRVERWRAVARDFSAALPSTVRTMRVYTNFPVVVLRLSDLEDAYALAYRDDVLSIEPDQAHSPTLTDARALIEQLTAGAGGAAPAAEPDNNRRPRRGWRLGVLAADAGSAGGAGGAASVAVLDTGADWAQADFGSCAAVGKPASCRVVYAADFAMADGSRDDSGHGTNVASLVAAAAPDLDLLALDVFRSDGYAYTTDILAAIDWVIDYRTTYDIGAIALGVKSAGYAAPSSDSYSVALARARLAGISVAMGR